jgi:DNA-binding GntR family transcriptional regulator
MKDGADAEVTSVPLDSNRMQLPDEVASYVRELILSRRVKRGEFLRLEPIAEALGVSNTPVREGLLALRAEGLVELVPRRGFVAGAFTRQGVEDLFWIQATLASELAARAASKITKDELRQLAQTHQAHRRAVEDGHAATVTDLGHQFHRLINLAARSPRLASLLGSTVRYLPNRLYASVEASVQSTLHAHPSILEALETGNPRLARTRMRDHILASGDSLIETLDARGVWDGETAESEVG